MKRILISGVILSVLFLLFAAEELLVEELRRLVIEEEEQLTDLLDEITFLTNLLEKKFTIKALLQAGDYAKIKELFLKDQQKIDALYNQFEGEKLLTFNNELKEFYDKIQIIEPFLLYNDGRGKYLIQNYQNAQINLEDIVDNYPSFELLDQTIVLLQEIYFKLGLHKEFISLYVQASNKNTQLQKYWLAHSHYNIENYEEAEKLFSSLKEDKNFGFRSEAMIALIANYTKGPDFAIEEFTRLLKAYPPQTEHYSFALLSLARLYADVDDIDIALQYYNLYAKNHSEEIPDEILFEIGLMNKNQGEYVKAIKYFDMIMKKPIKSEYYPSAKILATISQKQSGQYGEIETGLSEIISLHDVLLEILNAKYGLMDKYTELRSNYDSSSDDPEKKEEIINQMDKVENLLFNTNKTIENLYTGDDITTLVAISIMEEEYIYYTQTVGMMNSVVELARTTPNKRIPKSIEKNIAAGDEDILNLTILGFLGHLPNSRFTRDDYKFAQTLALEKVYDSQLIEMWRDIEKLSIEMDHEVVRLIADKYIELLNQNLKSYDVIAEIRFNGAPPGEFKELIETEIATIETSNRDLESLKQEVIKSFNKKIAERLDKQTQVLVVENKNLRNFYDTVLGNIISDVTKERNKNEFTLLDILYKQSKALDLEYQVKQYELRESEMKDNSGNE